MKPIRRSSTFEKNFKKRITANPKLLRQFEQRLALFMNGVADYPVNDHALVGSMKGLRAFSIASDIRLVYRETGEYYEFLDIGSHNQVY